MQVWQRTKPRPTENVKVLWKDLNQYSKSFQGVNICLGLLSGDKRRAKKAFVEENTSLIHEKWSEKPRNIPGENQRCIRIDEKPAERIIKVR